METFAAARTIGELPEASSKAASTSWAQVLQQPQLRLNALAVPQHHNKNIRDSPFSFTGT